MKTPTQLTESFRDGGLEARPEPEIGYGVLSGDGSHPQCSQATIDQKGAARE